MNTRKAALFTVGALTTAALALGGTAAANASTSDNAAIKSTTSSSSGSTYTVVAKNLTDDATAKITLSGTTVAYSSVTTKKVTDEGTVSYTFAVTRAGVYTVRFVADGEKVSKKITVGTTYSAATVDADSTTDKTTTIAGTAVPYSTVVVKVYEDGTILANKVVSVDSSGDYSTTFTKARHDGTYKVEVSYKATATHYGAKTYTDTFTRS